VACAVGALGISLAIPAATSFADLAGGCDFSPANNGSPDCLGPLGGSTFEGGDGNLLVNTTGNTDWANVQGLNPGFDLASGGGDNSFGKGTKEDDPNVSVVAGSIPPNKSDLTRFYEASEFSQVNNHNFLYLAWERTNVLGSANFDFEINQKTQPDLTTTGAKTLARTPGDLLVTYDFTNGGGRPAIGLLRWLTSTTTPVVPGVPTNACFSANTFPCWGDKVTLDGTDSIAAVNNLDSVTDPLFPNQPNYINPVPALQFGETAIDLTKAGVFAPGTCTAFGSAFVRSRSSASFTAEVKDFIAPIPVNISNCGQVTIIKHTDPRGINQGFSYTSTIPDPGPSSSTSCTQNSADPTPSGFTLNDNGNTTGDSTANTEDCVVQAGSYTVLEGAEPANFTLESLTCTDNGVPGSHGSQDGANPFQADISITPGGHVTCTYVNQQHLGAIKITKAGKDKNCTGAGTPSIGNGVCTGSATADLSGAGFSIKDSNGNPISASPVTTGSDGTVCVDHLPFGNYSVRETSAPNGYAIDDTTAHTVTVDTNSTCGDGKEAAFTAGDTPLTDLTVNAASQVSGATNSTITCVDSSNAGIGNSPQGPSDPAKVTANDLKPGTYTCTVVIDP
jgi:Prealbumin-like fold domain